MTRHLEAILNDVRFPTDEFVQNNAVMELFKYKRSIHPCPSWIQLGLTIADQRTIGDVCKRIGYNQGKCNLKKRNNSLDIRHNHAMSEQDIADFDHNKVYQWVRQGKWRLRDFERWLKVLRVIE